MGALIYYTYGAIQPGSGTILMPNVERVFPNTHIGGDGAGVVAIPNMDVYVPFNGVDEGFDEHLKVVIFDAIHAGRAALCAVKRRANGRLLYRCADKRLVCRRGGVRGE